MTSAKPMIREIEAHAANGSPVLLGLIGGSLACVALFAIGAGTNSPALALAAVLPFVAMLVGLAGLMNIAPNEARVLQLFGRRVVDTAEALFEVDDYGSYVHVQSEAALRNLATQYPCDDHTEVDRAVAAAARAAGDAGGSVAISAAPMSLRGSTQAIADQSKSEARDRLAKAGAEVMETRITHLTYAPEIAGAMLRRQQAGAIIAARQKVVEGAVGRVEMALAMLSEKNVVTLDDDRKAAMVSSLLVVPCGEKEATPAVNAGTIDS